MSDPASVWDLTMTLYHSLTGHDGMVEQTTIRRLGEIREDRTDWNRVVEQSEEDLIAAIRADPDDEELKDGWVERAIMVMSIAVLRALYRRRS